MISQAKEDSKVLKKAGLKLGLAFQIIDDVLDETQSSETLGKTAGKDSSSSKTTSTSVLGIEKSIELANKLVIEATEDWNLIYSKNKPLISVFSIGCNKSLQEAFKYLVKRTK